MKTKLIILVTLLFVICTGCKKNDCVKQYNPEDDNIVISLTDYNKASDISRKYCFYYSEEGCDISYLKELMSIKGKEIKAYGFLRYNIMWDCDALISPGENYPLILEGKLMDGLPHDSTMYYIVGIANFVSVPFGMSFKKTNEDDPDLTAIIRLKPLSYKTNVIN